MRGLAAPCWLDFPAQALGHPCLVLPALRGGVTLVGGDFFSAHGGFHCGSHLVAGSCRVTGDEGFVFGLVFATIVVIDRENNLTLSLVEFDHLQRNLIAFLERIRRFLQIRDAELMRGDEAFDLVAEFNNDAAVKDAGDGADALSTDTRYFMA